MCERSTARWNANASAIAVCNTSFRVAGEVLVAPVETYLAKQIARRNASDLRFLAADKGYDKQSLHKALRDLDISPLIKHVSL